MKPWVILNLIQQTVDIQSNFPINFSNNAYISANGLDMKNKKITNLLPPTLRTDAVNLGHLNTNQGKLVVATGSFNPPSAYTEIVLVNFPTGKTIQNNKIVILDFFMNRGVTKASYIASPFFAQSTP